MLGALATDAIFLAAVFFETLAAVSILQSIQIITLREEFEPVFAFYNHSVTPVFAFGASLFATEVPAWFTSATLIAAILFFLFFIAQARRAMAPYSDDPLPRRGVFTVTRVETAIDWLLPAVACAVGSALLALTLLPFLTLPAALWLAARKMLGYPSWFEVSRSFYVNALVVTAATAGIAALPR